MARLAFRSSAALALAAAFSMAATPAFAASFETSAPLRIAAPEVTAWSADQDVAHQYRGWGGGGYRGWDGGRHRHRGNGVSTGDVLAGVLIIGGIAAIATAASKNSRDRAEDRSSPDYRSDSYPGEDRQEYRDRDSSDQDGRGASYSDSRGLDRAAEMCANEVERSEPVDDVTNVTRNGDGWHVEGRLRNGHGFTCEIDNNGTVREVDTDRGVAAGPDNQRDDDYYARARERQGDAPYPGGV